MSWRSLPLLALCLLAPACTSTHQSLRESSPPLARGPGLRDNQGDAYYHYMLGMAAQRDGELNKALSYFTQALVFDPQAYPVMTVRGEVLFQLGKPEEAMEAVNQALSLDANYIPALVERGYIYAAGGMLSQARDDFDKVTSLDPRNESAWLELARVWWRMGEGARAIDILDTCESKNGRAPIHHSMLRAAILREQGHKDQAETVYLDILSDHSWYSEARRQLLVLYASDGGISAVGRRLEELHVAQPWQEWVPYTLVDLYATEVQLGELEAELSELETQGRDFSARLDAARTLAGGGHWDEAETILQPTFAWKGEDAQAALLLYGNLAFAQNKYEEALTRLEKVQEGSESYVDALTQRAFALELMGKLPDAVALVEGYLTQNPDSSQLRFTLGALYLEAKRYDAALAAFDQVLTRDPDHALAISQKARTLEEMGRSEEAVTLLQRSIERLPDQTRLHELLAAIYSQQRRFDDAVEVLEQALRRQPDDFSLRYSYGATLDRAGRREEGLAQMRLLLEADPDNSDVLNFIGYTYAEMGVRLSEAEMYIMKALEGDPDNGFIIDSLGWVYFKQAEYPKAVQTLERAVQLTEDEAVIIEHLADAYIKTGKKAEALYLLRQSLRLFEEDPQSSPDDVARVKKKIADLEARGVSATRPELFEQKKAD